MGTETFRFRVGSVECIAVLDGTNDMYKASNFFPGVPTEVIESELRPFGDSPSRIVSPYTCTAIRSGDGWILVDTGAGSIIPTTGRLRENLRSVGVVPESVGLVIITHAHPDHIGGITDDEGAVAYPNAQWVMTRGEWEFWHSPAARHLPEIFAQFIEKNLPPIKDRLTLVDDETEVAPGVWVVPAAGHTPGQAYVAVRSGGEELLCISDTVLHPLHLEHPDWHSVFDLDQERAIRSSQEILDLAANRGSLVLAFHFPFPSLGHVTRQESGWHWDPISSGVN